MERESKSTEESQGSSIQLNTSAASLAGRALLQLLWSPQLWIFQKVSLEPRPNWKYSQTIDDGRTENWTDSTNFSRYFQIG